MEVAKVGRYILPVESNFRRQRFRRLGPSILRLSILIPRPSSRTSRFRLPAHCQASGILESAMTTTTITLSPTTTSLAASNENSPGNGMASRPPPSTYLTIDGLLRKHASEHGEIPMFGYPASGASDYEVHTVKTVDRYVDAACWWYQKQGLQPAVCLMR